MEIIDLMTLLMGVRMGFLAFLLIGGASGAATWIFYPVSSNRAKPIKLLLACFLGFIAAYVSSLIGQYGGFFQAGQMLEWLSAIIASCLVGCVYTALAK